MALWLVRAGRHGEYEKKFLEEGRIYLTWDGLSTSLAALPNRNALTKIYQDTYPDASIGRTRNNVGHWVTAAHRLLGELWVDATTSEENELLYPVLERRVDDVRLDHQILINEIGPVTIVCQNATHFRRAG